MQPGNPPDEVAASVSLSSSALPVGWQGLTVLVVEDHPAYRILLGWILRKLGLGFVVVENGQAALDTLERQRMDLVLTDCQMPLMDGYVMTRTLRCRERMAGVERLPIIALTGTLGSKQIQRCVAAGMDAWLLKPVTFEQLRDILTVWLPYTDAPRELATRPAQAQWPTRMSLVDTFGCAAMVEQMLQTLVQEAHVDLAVLTEARHTRDTCAVTQHLHRLIGSVAFLGAGPLETRGLKMIEAVAREGVHVHARPLGVLLMDLRLYLKYLSSL